MIVIVDGYNVVKLVHGSERITEAQRSAFINLLGRYFAKRGHKIVVAFDAGPCPYPTHEKQRGVAIMYSGADQSADDLIMRFVEDHQGKEMLVVTADREIISHVTKNKADVMEPLLFYTKIKAVLKESCHAEKVEKKAGCIMKLSEEKNDILDAIMYQALSGTFIDKDDQETLFEKTSRKANGFSISKKERKNNKKIDKL